MITQKEIDLLWYDSQNVPGAVYKLNDSALINSGEHRGEYAAVISLVQLSPEPEYLVELGTDGSDLIIKESDLSPLE
ncbi:MAG: hypothetical protein IPM56_09240 [Ignavibacteriales bacterium]|nr:MAG: hypothetical protein IPM56_09240 [Ignavibacteriales bacterium]